jgi:DNA repair photolyase
MKMEPFSSEDFHRDSTMFGDQLVEHLTSWLTINPYKGCSLGCAYCFRARWYPSNEPEQVQDVVEAVEALIQHPAFRANETPVSINNSSTDPLLPAVRKSTFKAIELLELKRLRNPFSLISKLELKQAEIEFLENLRFVRPIMFVSLSLIPRHIEPTPIAPRLRNLQKLSETRIPCVLYFRPVVKGWNDSPEIIEAALTIGQTYCDAICIGSLRVSPEIRMELSKRGVQIETYKNDFHLKNFSSDIENRILRTYEQMKLGIPLFKHSSCAVSYILRTANYNLLFKNPDKNCLRTCPALQQNLCRPQI